MKDRDIYLDSKRIVCEFRKALNYEQNIISVSRIPNSYGHVCWKIRTHNDVFIFKVNIRHSKPAEFLNEIASHRLALKIGILAPELVAVMEDPTELGKPYYIQKWVPGLDGTNAIKHMTNREIEQLAYDFGCLVAQMHTTTCSYFSEYIENGERFSTWHDLYIQRLRRSIFALRKTSILSSHVLDFIEERVESVFLSMSDNIIKPAFTHGDLHLSNIITTNNKLSSIIDFESSKWFDPVWDFVKLDSWVFRMYNNFRKPFMDGYKTIIQWQDHFNCSGSSSLTASSLSFMTAQEA